jgi:hypothetical protein
MKLIYYQESDSARVLTHGDFGPDDTEDVRELDSDRIVRSDADGNAILYEFFHVRRDGVRLDDLDPADRDGLAAVFREAGFTERDWSRPIEITAVRRRRDRAAG